MSAAGLLLAFGGAHTFEELFPGASEMPFGNGGLVPGAPYAVDVAVRFDRRRISAITIEPVPGEPFHKFTPLVFLVWVGDGNTPDARNSCEAATSGHGYLHSVTPTVCHASATARCWIESAPKRVAAVSLVRRAKRAKSASTGSAPPVTVSYHMRPASCQA